MCLEDNREMEYGAVRDIHNHEINMNINRNTFSITLTGRFKSKCPVTKDYDIYNITVIHDNDNFLELFEFKSFLASYEEKEIFMEDILKGIHKYVKSKLITGFKIVIEDNSAGFNLKGVSYG